MSNKFQSRLYTPEDCKKYRKVDDTVSSHPAYIQYENELQNICNSFPCKIDVLEIGVGTGRFLPALRNTNIFVGLDINVNMLLEAKTPHHKEIAEQNIIKQNFICANIHEFSLPREYFDFIYSIGTLDEHTYMDVDTLYKIWYSLRTNGIVYITANNMTQMAMEILINHPKLLGFSYDIYALRDAVSRETILKARKNN